MTEEERNQKINQIKAILSDAGITMSVGACGCCQSPWVKLEYNGVTIDILQNADFDMFDHPLKCD